MSEHLSNLTFEVTAEQVRAISDIHHRALVLLGRLRVLRDGSVEVEDDYAAGALDSLSQRLILGISREAITAVEERSGMPWSVFVGQCVAWWEGIGQPQRGGSTCMPRGLASPMETESIPRVKRPSIHTDAVFGSLATPSVGGALNSSTEGLSLWSPQTQEQNIKNSSDSSMTSEPTPLYRQRPPVPPVPFLAILVERIGSLDIYFKGLQWNRGRRVPMRVASAPLWPIVAGALLAIIMSGRSWWAPWPIMSFFGAGFGWLTSQALSKKRFCGGVACSQPIRARTTQCPRCGGELIRQHQ